MYMLNSGCTTNLSHDAELARLLVGTWITNPDDKSQVVSTITYKSDGTGTESVRLRDQPESTSIVVTTRWSIKDDILSLKSVTSSDPQRIPVGIELKDRIISISENRFVFEAFEGYDKAIKGTQGTQVRKNNQYVQHPGPSGRDTAAKP